MQRLKEITKAEIYVEDNFMTPEECDEVISIIERNKPQRSTVVNRDYDPKNEEHTRRGVVDPNRTSDTAQLPEDEPILARLNVRMHNLLNIPLGRSEQMQGQRYLPGQEFRDHLDWFSPVNENNDAAYKHAIGKTGNRTWTLMVYLNDDCEGGETDFPRLGVKFTPRKGQAVIWRNLDENGKGNPDVLHAGRPVKKGAKYIITKWFRQASDVEIRGKEIKDRQAGKPIVTNQAVQVENKNINIKSKEIFFKNARELPRLTQRGFDVIRIPRKEFGIIKDVYELLKSSIKKESDSGIIFNNKGEAPSEILSFDHAGNIREFLHHSLQPIHEEWIGRREPLVPSAVYGIRSYKNGSTLGCHVDRVATHHVSSILIVDKQGNPWPLDIQDHEGKWHEVYAEPGEMILYESAICSHCRKQEFQGDFFRNFYVHYKLKNWSYIPPQGETLDPLVQRLKELYG